MSLPLKVKICYVNFLLMVIFGLITYITGLVPWIVVPRGEGYGRHGGEDHFWGLDRRSWINIHVASSLVLLALVLVHIVLNWAWITNITRCLFKKRK